MSKLIERLRRASEGVSQPMGFAALALERVPSVVLMAHLTKATGELPAAAVKNGAEFLLFSTKNGRLPEPLPPKNVGETAWGVRAASLDEEQHRALKEAGCDFVLLSFGETPARLLSDEDLGVVALVPLETDDRTLRALEQLPFDTVLIESAVSGDLTVKQLLDYATIASGLGQNLIAPVSASWGGPEIEQLRELGFTGLLVDVTSTADLEGLQALRKAAVGLPARSRKREERLRARLPQLAGTASPSRREEEEEEEEDE